MTQQRKLAAVMFTDIIGYTALMSKDEQRALKTLQKNRDIQKSLAEKHNGEFLKEMGDGTLLCFQSALDAVRCAMDIQQSVKDDPDLNLRIGIHLGDIVFREGDVFGDGVNVASRIERLAEVGGICISEQIYKLIRNQPDIPTTRLGEKKLKNIDHPVTIYAIGVSKFPEKKISETVETSDRRKKKVLILATALIGLTITLFFISRFFLKSPDLIENRVTIAFFENETGDPAYDFLEQMTSEVLHKKMEEAQFIQLAPTVSQDVLKEFSENRNHLERLAEQTKANIVVSGRIYKQGEHLQFQTNVIEIGNDQSLVSIPVISGLPEHITDIIEELSQRILGALGVRFDFEWKNVRYYLKTAPLYKAFVELKEGTKLFWNFENNAAIERFAKASEIDSSLTILELLTLFIHNNRGMWTKAETVVYKLNKKRETLTQAERLWLLWEEKSLKGDLKEVLKYSRSLAEFDSDWYFNTALAAYALNKIEEAEQWLEKCNDSDILVTNWEYYWRLFGSIAHLMGKFEKELELANAYRNHFPESISAAIRILIAYIALGDLQKVHESYSELYTMSGFISPGSALTQIAKGLKAHGYITEARVYVEKAIEWYIPRWRDNMTGLSQALYLSLFSLGDYDYEVTIMNDESQKQSPADEKNARIKMLRLISETLARENPDQIPHRGWLGMVYAKIGENEMASEIFNWLGKIDRPYVFGQQLKWQAILAIHMGDLSRAASLLEDAHRSGMGFNIDFHNNPVWDPLREHPRFDKFMSPKK